MTVSSITSRTCDRCGVAETFVPPATDALWAGIWARQNNGAFQIGAQKMVADLCPACQGTLKSWWLDGAAAAAAAMAASVTVGTSSSSLSRLPIEQQLSVTSALAAERQGHSILMVPSGGAAVPIAGEKTAAGSNSSAAPGTSAGVTASGSAVSSSHAATPTWETVASGSTSTAAAWDIIGSASSAQHASSSTSTS